MAEQTAPVQKATKTPRQWYTLRAYAAKKAADQPPGKADQDEPDTADLSIHDAIGDAFEGVTAKDFLADLKKLPASVKTINVSVSSPGGNVTDALAIANALQQHPAEKNVSIDGIAASAATIVTQGSGSKTVKMADNALLMIHSPFADASMATAKDMRRTAEMLDRAQASIVATYQRLSPLSAEKLCQMMDDVTWMTADEAVANGFATEVVKDAPAATAYFDARMMASLAAPEKYRAQLEALVQPKNDMSIASGANGTSIEEFTDAVFSALKAVLGDPWAPGATYWYICQTYIDAVIVNKGGETWEYPLTVSGDGDEVTLGQPFEVEMVWVKSPEAGATAALTTRARAVAANAAIVPTPEKPPAAAPAQPVAAAPPPTPIPATAPPVAAAADVISLCAQAGLDIQFAQVLIAANLGLADVTARITTEKDARKRSKDRETAIRALCAKAKQGGGDLSMLAEDLVAGGMTVDQVGKHLSKVTALLDKVEIDGALLPDAKSTTSSKNGREPELDARAIYAERNRPRTQGKKE